MSSISSINVVKSRKIAADTCSIVMNNMFNSYAQEPDTTTTQQYADIYGLRDVYACVNKIEDLNVSRIKDYAEIWVFLGAGLANEMFDVFLNTEFEGGRHQRRVDQITAIENGTF